MSQTASLSSSFAQPFHIALLEDDVELRERIMKPHLEESGFSVTSAGSAAELYRCMLNRSFDIVVLDIGLPDESGLTVARYLREASTVGIVMLTGSHGKRDRVQALTVGADAYLAKPLDVEVLVATLHSLGRRLGQRLDVPSQRTPAPGPKGWHLDTDGWRLISPAGVPLTLTASERLLVGVLLGAEGRPVSRESLIAALCSDVYEFDPHRLDMLVHRLRRKALEAGVGALPLVTARGCGYLFVKKR